MSSMRHTAEERTALRIALFTETFLPKVDGIVTTLRHLLTHLDERGHEAMLFAPDGGPEDFAGTRVIGVRAAPMPLYPEMRVAFPPPLFRIRPLLDDFEPDLVHLVNPVSLGLAGMRYARQRAVPIVASYHTDLPGMARRWGLRGVGPALWRFIRFYHGDAALNLTPSAETRDELAAQGIPHLAVWGCGVDTSTFSPTHRDAAWRTRLTDDHS